MIDFCYFFTLSAWLNTLICPNDSISEHCEIWFKTNFVLAMGPISFAIVAWQNSLVFHSVDKVTSFALHVLPALTCYLIKWDQRMVDAGLGQEKWNSLTFSEVFLYPMGFYLSWQLFYFYIQFTIIEKDKALITSLRHLANDAKNPSTKVGYKLATYLGKWKYAVFHNCFILFYPIYLVV